MIKQLFDPLFVLYSAIWGAIRLFRLGESPLPWVNDWLTDFVFIPVVAHLSLTFTRHIVLKNNTYRYPLYYLLLAWIYVAVVCEGLLPLFLDRAVVDSKDVIAYLGGSMFYYYVHQKSVFH